jgi:hypothetical protein
MALSTRQAAAGGAISSGAATGLGFGIGSLFGGPMVGGMIGAGAGTLLSGLFNLGAEAPEIPGPTGGQKAAAAGLQTTLGQALRQRGLTAGQVSRQYQAAGLQQETLSQQIGTLDRMAATPFEREGLARVLLGEARRTSTSLRRDIAELDIEADLRRTQQIATISKALAGVSSDIQRIQTEKELARQRFEAAKWQNFSKMTTAATGSIVAGVMYNEAKTEPNPAELGRSGKADEIKGLPKTSDLQRSLEEQFPMLARVNLLINGG